MLNWIVRNKTVSSFDCVYLQNEFTNHLFNIYLKPGFDINSQQLLIYHKTKINWHHTTAKSVFNINSQLLLICHKTKINWDHTTTKSGFDINSQLLLIYHKAKINWDYTTMCNNSSEKNTKSPKWTYNECDSLNISHKITINTLVNLQNQSINHKRTLLTDARMG